MTKRGDIAIKNIFSNLLLQFVVIISGFIMPKLLISTYGSDVYGLVASITQFLSLITLLESGIGPLIKANLYKLIAKKDKKKITLLLKDSDNFFKKIGYIFIGYVVILSLIYPFMNNEFDKFFTISLIVVMSISTMFEYFFGIVYNLYLQADKKYYITSYTQIICYIVNIIIVVILVHYNAPVLVVKIANTFAFLIRPIYQYYYVKKKLGINIKEAKGEYKIKNKFDGLSQHIAYVIYSNTDVTVLTIFSNLSSVAIYSVYNLVATAIKNVVSAFSNSMDSIFGDMFANNEKDVLRRCFRMYEFIYYTIIMIIYAATLILIVPFIKIYTSGITDANYIRPLFAIIIILAGLAYCIRNIYSTLVYSIGHFRQTNFVCWIEAITNLGLSIILVSKYGLIGVAIGTLVATLIRLVYFMYYSSKVVLETKTSSSFKWLFLVTIEVAISILIYSKPIINYVPTNYLEWAGYAVIIVIIISIIILIINILTNYQTFKEVILLFKEKLERKRIKNE